MCANFVASMYGAVGLGGYSSAADQWSSIPSRLKNGGYNAPPGALLFWGGGYGHVAISAGGGWVYTTDFDGRGVVSLVKASDITAQWGKPFQGWSQPYWGGHTVKLKGDGDTPPPEAGGGGGGNGEANDRGKDNLSRQEMAERYGFAMSFLKSEPELWKLFQKAYQHGWSADQFVAELRDTKWYKQHNETWRQNALLKSTDPATYRDRLQEIRATLKDMAASMGATLSDHQMDQVAENALMFGWSDAQISNTLADYVKRIKGSFVGDAGSAQDELEAFARDMGVRVNREWINNAVRNMSDGDWDIQRAKDKITRIAVSQFPNLADDLKSGSTVYDLAAGYLNTKAQLLELNPSQVDLFDKDVRRALSSRDKDGKPGMMTLWEFEQKVRSDPAWKETNNGRETIAQGMMKVLQDFGFTAT